MDSKRHIYLYAKGWYKTTDIKGDLKIIVANYTMVPVKYITTNDVISILYGILDDHINLYDCKPSRLINRIIEHNTWYKKDNVNSNFISAALSIIGFIRVSDIPFDIGKPDPKILPLKKHK